MIEGICSTRSAKFGFKGSKGPMFRVSWTPKVGTIVRSPKLLQIAQKALVLHTFGVQVRVSLTQHPSVLVAANGSSLCRT